MRNARYLLPDFVLNNPHGDSCTRAKSLRCLGLNFKKISWNIITKDSNTFAFIMCYNEFNKNNYVIIITKKLYWSGCSCCGCHLIELVKFIVLNINSFGTVLNISVWNFRSIFPFYAKIILKKCPIKMQIKMP